MIQIITTLKRTRHRLQLAPVALALLALPGLASAQPTNAGTLLEQARQTFAAGQRDVALRQATEAIAAEPKNPRGYFLRAQFHEESRELTNAVADYDQVIRLDPRLPDAWQGRGSTRFKLGQIRESIADFDKFVELVSGQAPYHWQRGISYYYAGRFEDGRKQFELHQTVNPNDVENAVWHFLCAARASSVEKARAALIPIQGDARVPMMQVHALFAGKLKPEDVLQAAAASNAPPARLNHQLFYAHLYLGLYFEALGDDQKAREHITQAAGPYQTGDYMGDVARVHLELRWPKEKSSGKANKSP
jgi:lipoprotein NlpI